MFDHVTVRVSDRGESERFYDAVLGELGIVRSASGEQFAECDEFSLCEATRSRPVTRRLHIAFVAPSREHVEAFWRAGTEAGYMDDGRPGLRPRYGDDYFGGFLRDPYGISVEAVHHAAVRPDGVVDHVWMRVADVPASRRFWETVAPQTRYLPASEHDDRVHFAGDGASFSIVAGRPTEGLHVAFPASSGGEVEAFHRAAVAAGYRDNGAPGERPQYHAGCTAAFVLDPDGTNVELVCHRPA